MRLSIKIFSTILCKVLYFIVILSVVLLTFITLNVVILSVIMLCVVRLNVAMLNNVMTNVFMIGAVMLSIVMPSVIMLSVIMSNVVAPYWRHLVHKLMSLNVCLICALGASDFCSNVVSPGDKGTEHFFSFNGNTGKLNKMKIL